MRSHRQVGGVRCRDEAVITAQLIAAEKEKLVISHCIGRFRAKLQSYFRIITVESHLYGDYFYVKDSTPQGVPKKSVRKSLFLSRYSGSESERAIGQKLVDVENCFRLYRQDWKR